MMDHQMVLQQQPARRMCAPPTASADTVDGPADGLHAVLATALDRLAQGVAIVDVTGRRRFANAAARAVLDRWGAGGGASAAWTAALRQACLRGRRELVRPGARDDGTFVLLVPLAVHEESLALAVFGRDELCGHVELQMVALRHQLTPAETEVLRQLARGLNAGAIAQAHGVARTTVLTQIAALRAKTRCASVRSLMLALAGLPAVRSMLLVADA